MTEEIWDVVIVGAGLSGLSAAHFLKKNYSHLKILILEAKDRVGGRTLSKEIPASSGHYRWDLGGQWVGRTQTHIMELIQELGLEVYPQYNTGKKVHHIGGPGAKIRTYSTSIPALSPLVLLDVTQLFWKIDRLCATLCVEDPSKSPNAEDLDSMTLYSYVKRHAWTQEVIEEMGLLSRVVFGMEPSQMSFLYFLMYAAAAGGVLALLESTPGAAQEFRVKGGTQQLSEALAERVGWEIVRTGSAVTSIWQDAEWAAVKTSTRSFQCKAVVVTCPPHLAAKIHYEPALPSQREFLTQNMPVGHMIKFLLTYQTAFWREKGFSGEIVAQPSPECPFSVTFDATSPSGNAALVGFIAGLQASEWSRRKMDERREAVVSSLVRYLGPEAAFYIHYEEQDWAKEAYSGGCPVNVMAPGLLTYYHPSLRKPCGRIHWAGTETATQWCGYMSGAVQAGQRAALEVLACLCPSSLTRASPQEQQSTDQNNQPGTLSARDAALSSKPSRRTAAALLALLAVGTAFVAAQPRLVLGWTGKAMNLLRK